MSLRRNLLVLGFLGAITGGCSIHPLPDDVVHVETYQIVRQIRCETRKAVIGSLFRYLTTPQNMNFGHLDQNSYRRGLAAKAEYEVDPNSITSFDPSKLTGMARSIVGLMYHTGVAYNYDLIGVETNNFDPAASLIRPLPVSSLLTMGAGINFDRQRQNERAFTVTDTFGGLIAKVPESYCRTAIAGENFVYPIAGKVGIDRVVHDFMLLTLFGNLGGSSKDVTVASGPPTMVDQLQFQTTIGGSVSPKITFIPMGRAFQFSEASFPFSASRKDTHQLTVGLYLDKVGAAEVGGVRSALFLGQFVTASGGRAEKGAALAVEQFLAQRVFKPTIVVAQ